ncbi:MAG: hypothetical protein ACREOO_20770 [bacterium]
MPSQRYFECCERVLGFFLICLALIAKNDPANAQSKHTVNVLADLSGLAWIEGDTFLAVHDAKNPEENPRPRVSTVSLPNSLAGIAWNPFDLEWPPPLGLSSDLESISRIPGKQSFLLVESGEGMLDNQQFRRIFLVECREQQWDLVSFATLPESAVNVEGTAVARLGERLAFIFAERADGQPSTNLMWAELQLQPLELGLFQHATFRPPDFTGPNWRPVSAIEIDRNGRVYLASAFDPGDDNGPFRSVIWRAGQIKLDAHGKFALVLEAQPHRLAVLDGLKVESLAVREQAEGKPELFAGTDDENYGGALRLIPLQP